MFGPVWNMLGGVRFRTEGRFSHMLLSQWTAAWAAGYLEVAGIVRWYVDCRVWGKFGRDDKLFNANH